MLSYTVFIRPKGIDLMVLILVLMEYALLPKDAAAETKAAESS